MTTAYHQYAIQGYELAIVDYLLKPIEFERFLQAVNRLKVNSLEKEVLPPKVETDYYFFNVNKKNIKVRRADILYVESLKEYVRIVTPQQKLVTKYQIGTIHQLLGERDFIRIHRSFLVAKQHIYAFSTTVVEVGNIELPIGRSYRKRIAQAMR